MHNDSLCHRIWISWSYYPIWMRIAPGMFAMEVCFVVKLTEEEIVFSADIRCTKWRLEIISRCRQRMECVMYRNCNMYCGHRIQSKHRQRIVTMAPIRRKQSHLSTKMICTTSRKCKMIWCVESPPQVSVQSIQCVWRKCHKFFVRLAGKRGLIYNGIPDWFYANTPELKGETIAFSADGSYLSYLSFNDSDVNEYRCASSFRQNWRYFVWRLTQSLTHLQIFISGWQFQISTHQNDTLSQSADTQSECDGQRCRFIDIEIHQTDSDSIADRRQRQLCWQYDLVVGHRFVHHFHESRTNVRHDRTVSCTDIPMSRSAYRNNHRKWLGVGGRQTNLLENGIVFQTQRNSYGGEAGKSNGFESAWVQKCRIHVETITSSRRWAWLLSSRGICVHIWYANDSVDNGPFRGDRNRWLGWGEWNYLFYGNASAATGTTAFV